MKKKRTVILACMLLLLIGLTGCNQGKQEGGYVVYYLNTDITRIMPKSVDLNAVSGKEMIDELLQALQSNPEDTGMRQTIPKSIKVLGVNTTSYQIIVDFSKEYYDLTPTEEILTRAAIAKTLLQVKEYQYVMFTVESMPLKNANGFTVGSMNTDSFVENPGQQINSKQQTTLTLYFASKAGSELVRENRVVRYSSNISMEKLVMEQLFEGPKNADCQATIPVGTKLIKVSVVDGICYVNMDETFLNQNMEITEEVVLYSIVDSLTALSGVDKVQISINGDTGGKCRYEYDFSTMYEEDLSMVMEEITEEVSSEQ